mgnify:FL=1
MRLRIPLSAARYRLLRREDDQFTGWDDESAFVVSEGVGNAAIFVMDDTALVNGRAYYYRLFEYRHGEWSITDTGAGTPQASYFDRSVDPHSVVRSRLEDGLAVECARGDLVHADNQIPVLTAPPVFEDTQWPVVTVHLQQESPSGRGLGEIVDPDEDDNGEWTESEGWLARTQLTVIGWTINPDERIALRKSIRRIVIGNLPVFEGNSMSEIEVSFQDLDDMESYSAPVHQAVCTITCLAPAIVSSKVGSITDVNTVVRTTL